jgi:hypothetical protein
MPLASTSLAFRLIGPPGWSWQVQLPFAGVDFDDALLAMFCLLRGGDVCVVLLCVVVAAAVFLLFAMVARCYVG